MVVDDFATITQKRMTGGLRLDDIAGMNIHIDPGPGALVRSYQFGLDPRKLDAVMVSHSHTDHYTDAEVLIEAMTRGMTRHRGAMIGSLSVMEGYRSWGPCISDYHKGRSECLTLAPDETLRLGGLEIRGTETVHGDPTGVGFQLKTEELTVSYTSDTEYFDGLPEEHMGADVLISSVIRPENEHIRGHMCTDDFIKLVEEVSPRVAVMTHLGMKMILDNPEGEAMRVQEATKTRVLAARDGMSLKFDDGDLVDVHVKL
ncbi:MBL fold metallo-hydrolase [Methanothermobacter wolfeii]|uniref:MBL fold metallo-hydrolase n=1 Tax=Methanothermobacter wolfeii TaxID=145261 RepID=A0ABU8TUK7_METWO|nr:MBL fold metallo-hydrolase [Methanothermobacter wolfeii]QHN07232.1 MBL fold metallo-hydrolase [Methanothermobacter sp. THM-1]